MNHFAVLDASGQVIRTGQCPPEEHDAQVGEGETLHVGDVQLGSRRLAGTDLFVTPTPLSPLNAPMPRAPYAVRRAAAYPSLEQQLDDLWHAMESGALPRAEPFYSRILAVKQAHPKE